MAMPASITQLGIHLIKLFSHSNGALDEPLAINQFSTDFENANVYVI